MNPEELKTFGEKDPENVRRNALTSDGLIGKYLANDYLGALLLPLYPSKAVNTPYDREKEPRSQFSHSAIAFVHAGLCPSTYKKLGKFPTRINSIAKDLVKRLQDFLSTNTGNQPFGMGSHVVFLPCDVVDPLRSKKPTNSLANITL